MSDFRLQEDKAFVDNTPVEEMTATRKAAKPSPLRNQKVAENARLWGEMQKASAEGLKCVVRIKLDPASANGAMRDPPIYRCKPEPHVRTGTKYKVYPLYDFACPLVDSKEGVTHALRTTEYDDRNPQYIAIAEKCGLRVPEVESFSRMDLQYTCLAKRQLRWFVNNNKVSGWTDPRFPTVRGILRRGLTVDGLRKFILEMGSSKTNAKMSWDKIWSINRQIIDPVAPRHTALVKLGLISATLEGVSTTKETKPLHPKNPDVGSKVSYTAGKVLLQMSDIANFTVGDKVTLMDYGNVEVKSIETDCGLVTSVVLTPKLDDTSYKGTQKLTWIADCAEETTVPVTCMEYGHLITAEGGVDKASGEAGLAAAFNEDSEREFALTGAASMASLQRGDILQISRLGYWVCDQSYNKQLNKPVVLLSIPDGKEVKDRSILQQASYIEVTDDMVSEATDQLKLLKEAQVTLKKGKADQDTKKANAAKVASADTTLTVLKAALVNAGGGGTAAAPAKKAAAPAEKAAPAAAPAAVSGAAAEILAEVEAAGAAVRELKAAKAPKTDITAAVGALLALKKAYKDATGQDVPAPGKGPSKKDGKAAKKAPAASKAVTADELAQKIRDLKKAGASVADVTAAVKAYQDATGGGGGAAAAAPPASAGAGAAILAQIDAQGLVVRDLKTDKADKAAIKEAVAVLLQLKADYKTATGEDVPAAGKAGKRDATAPKAKALAAAAAPVELTGKAKEQFAKITAQGLVVRDLKAAKADPAETKAAVAVLLDLKATFKEVTGQDLPGARAPKEKKGKAKKEVSKADKAKALALANKKGETKLGVGATKEGDFSTWYSEVITKAEMIEYYPISGCYILRPSAYIIWDYIHDFFDAEIKKMGVENCYFPLFVPKSALEKEKDHIEDFAPEVAWVTKSGDTDLAEPIAIRPTSETVMYPAFKRWIRSHRDLPMKLNQWCNVVRWEFKHPQPFLRTREFLWQEGHTAYADRPSAETEVLQILDLYTAVYQDLLAVPVVRGRKTEKEKFAGGDYTTTVEAFIGTTGRSIQGATSHHLGQNFSKMFDIEIQDPDNESQKRFIYQNSWGITTRTIGVMVMVHGDDKGLVLPPRVSQHQIVCIPTGIGGKNAPVAELNAKCTEYTAAFQAAGIRGISDIRDNYSPGWKFSNYEMKGVCALPPASF